MRTSKTDITPEQLASFPLPVQERVRELTVYYDRANITRANGEYSVGVSACIQSHYAIDHAFWTVPASVAWHGMDRPQSYCKRCASWLTEEHEENGKIVTTFLTVCPCCGRSTK